MKLCVHALTLQKIEQNVKKGCGGGPCLNNTGKFVDMGFPSWIRIDFFTLHPHSTMLGCSKWSTENIWESGTYEWMFYPLLQGFGNPLICGDIMASHDTQVILLISCWCKNPPKNCHLAPWKWGKSSCMYRLPNPSQFSGGFQRSVWTCMWGIVFKEGDGFSQMFKSLLWCNGTPSHGANSYSKNAQLQLCIHRGRKFPISCCEKKILRKILSKQRKNISHQKGTPENHRSKSTLVSDMLVLRRVYKVWWKHITIDIDGYLIVYLTSISAVWTVFCKVLSINKRYLENWQVPPQGHEFFDRSPMWRPIGFLKYAGWLSHPNWSMPVANINIDVLAGELDLNWIESYIYIYQ